MADEHLKQVRDMYSRRAARYESSNGGWHTDLALDFVEWLNPQPGEQALDLACGTGLVTIPLAAVVGPSGRVVGVDLTAKMMDVGKARLQSVVDSSGAAGLAPIEWIEQDIASLDLLKEPAVRQVLEHHGGFDMISVCSAFILLPDPAAALQFWTEKLLRTGGRVIIDVPTEDITLQLLVPTFLPDAIGLSDKFANARDWIRDQSSLAQAMETTGLAVDKNLRTKSYVEETWYPDTQESAQKVLEMELENTPIIAQRGKSDQVRQMWPEVWRMGIRTDRNGKPGVTSAYWLYVSVGRKV